MFWTTNHDFKPRVLRSHAKLEACAAAFLNVYPFVAVLFIKLCVFLTFTASDPRFNFVWNIVFAMQYVAVIALFTVRVTSNNVKWARVIAGRRDHINLFVVSFPSFFTVNSLLFFVVSSTLSTRAGSTAAIFSVGSKLDTHLQCTRTQQLRARDFTTRDLWYLLWVSGAGVAVLEHLQCSF